MAWNTVYTSTDDLFDVAVINRYVDALNERFYANGGLAVSALLSSPLPYFVDGDDAQSASTYAFMQAIVERCIGFYLDRAPTYDATTFTAGNYQLNANVFGSWANYCAVKRGGNAWTRKYPREFDTLAATQYRDTTAFANGHLAYNRADDRVYLRSAGAWVVQPVGTDADTITAYGQAQEGDFVGPWILNELRDAINDCVWFTLTAGMNATVGGGMLSAEPTASTGTSNVSIAAAYADALANFPQAGDPSSVDRTSGAVASSAQGSYNPNAGGPGVPGWGAFPLNEEGPVSISVSGYSINPPPTCDLELYVCPDYFATVGGFPAASVYECPFGYAFRTRHKVGTYARAGAAHSVPTATFSNALTTLTNPPPDPATVYPGAGFTYNGWRAAWIVIVRCDVAGGYVYHA